MVPGLAARRDFAREQGSGMHVAARRNPHQQSLFARQAPHHAVGVLGLDPQVAVGQRVVVKAGTDRGRHVLQAFQAMEAAGGLRRDSTSRPADRGATAA